MKRSRFKKVLLAALLLLLFMLWWGQTYSDQGGVLHRIKMATAPFDHRAHEARLGSVPPLPEKTVPVKISALGRPFWTETRKDKIERFACSRCHNDKPVTIARAAEMAHGTILLDHGGQERPLSCFTCHKEEERDVLVTERGTEIDMDHSYLLCGQCHFRQKKDWVGGAHGKRVAAWAGRRVVKNCTSCHDPHSPRFAKRWPKTYSPPLAK